MACRQAGALDKWHIDHQADPASSHARQSLYDLCRDPTRSLHAHCAAQEIRHPTGPSPTLLSRFSLALDLLCKSPLPKFVNAQCRASGPKNPQCCQVDLPISGGHKQIRTRFSIVNHWDTGAVSVQGREAHMVAREAHMVARQMESTRSRPLAADAPNVAADPTETLQAKRRSRHRPDSSLFMETHRHRNFGPALGVHSRSPPKSFFSPGAT